MELNGQTRAGGRPRQVGRGFGAISEGARRPRHRLRLEARPSSQRNPAAAGARNYGRNRRPRRPHLPRAGSDRGQPGRSRRRSATGAGARARANPSSAKSNWRRSFFPGRIVAITGANGKTTTTTLAGEIIAAGGISVLWSAATSALRPSRLADQARPRHWIRCSRFRAFSWKPSSDIPSADRRRF